MSNKHEIFSNGVLSVSPFVSFVSFSFFLVASTASFVFCVLLKKRTLFGLRKVKRNIFLWTPCAARPCVPFGGRKGAFGGNVRAIVVGSCHQSVQDESAIT